MPVKNKQIISLLSSFIKHATDGRFVDTNNKIFFKEINSIFNNPNTLDKILYDLNESGIINYEEIGEDGFSPIIIAGLTEKTTDYLNDLLLTSKLEVNPQNSETSLPLVPTIQTDQSVQDTTNPLGITLFEKIGSGMWADVWSAKDQIREKIAVKIMYPQSYSPDVSSMILNHAKQLCKVKHQNVISVYYVSKFKFPKDDTIHNVIVMEYFDGEPLENKLRQRIPTTAAKLYGIQVIEGLQELHKNDVPHNDLHSKNILCNEKEIKIIDVFSNKSTAYLETGEIESSKQNDIEDLKMLLTMILQRCTDVKLDDAFDFETKNKEINNLEEIKENYEKIFSQNNSTAIVNNIEVRNEKASRYISRINKNERLSALIPEILIFSQKYRLNELFEFCSSEILGYLEDTATSDVEEMIRKEGGVHPRNVHVFIMSNPIERIFGNPNIITDQDLTNTITQSPGYLSDTKHFISDRISYIEEKAQDSKDLAFVNTTSMPINEIFPGIDSDKIVYLYILGSCWGKIISDLRSRFILKLYSVIKS